VGCFGRHMRKLVLGCTGDIFSIRARTLDSSRLHNFLAFELGLWAWSFAYLSSFKLGIGLARLHMFLAIELGLWDWLSAYVCGDGELRFWGQT